MANGSKSEIVRHLRLLVASWKEDPRTDMELLGEFCQSRDEQAFTTIVGRHSRLVWGACTRVLGNSADSEDAFQATFLRLSRDANKILHRQNLATWLYRVARCSAIDLQRANSKHRKIERRLIEVADRSPGGPNPTEQLRTILDDELDQLPERYRTVLILCHLEGRTYADVSRELGCSIAAVHRLASRAQDHLRRRLVKQGYSHARATTCSLAALLAGDISAAPLRVQAGSIVQGMACSASGVFPATRAGAVAALVPTAGVSLSPTVLVTGLILLALVMPTVILTGLSGSSVSAHSPGGHSTPRDTLPLAAQSDPLPSVVTLSGTILGPEGQADTEATIVVLGRYDYESRSRGLRDVVLNQTVPDATGRFRLSVPEEPRASLSERILTVQVTGSHRTPTSRTIRVHQGRHYDLGHFRSEPATVLRGRLVDTSGRPVEGVPLRVARIGDVVAEPVIGATEPVAPPGWPEPVRTGPNGEYALPGLGNARNVWVEVADPRFALDSIRVDQQPTAATLIPARGVVIRVIAADTGQPLNTSRVTILTERLRSHTHFCVADVAAIAASAVPPEEFDFVTDRNGEITVGLAPGEPVEILVHPPEGPQPYIGVRRVLTPGRAGWMQTETIALPRGEWVEGTVRDEATGQPIPGAAVHWGRDDATKPEWRDDYLVGRDALTRTGPEGTFKIAVLPGPVSLRVYGPTLDYPSVSLTLPGTRGTTLFAHAVERLHRTTVSAPGSHVEARLRTGFVSECRIEGHPETGRLVALCSGRVSPIRGYAALPIPVYGRTLRVPGCVPGLVTRAYLLDPVARLGGLVDLGTTDTVSLQPCGQVQVTLTTPDGSPIAGCEVTASLLLERDRPAGVETAGADPQPTDWHDFVNYPGQVLTDATGRAMLPALIPGADYTITAIHRNVRTSLGTVRIAPGGTIALPAILTTDPATPGVQP